ncbi:hypothetical protein ACWCXX_38585 [Streptomyces sp. NPDC001732]
MLVPLPGLGRGEVAEDLVFAQAAVAERLDEVEDLSAGGGPVGPDAGADLFFEQGPETLRGGIVEAGSGASAALPEPQLAYFTPELTTRLFAAAIRMRYTAGPEPAPACGHLQRIDDKVGAVVVGHRVADDLAGGQVWKVLTEVTEVFSTVITSRFR